MNTLLCPRCSSPISSPDEVCKTCLRQENVDKLFNKRARRFFSVYLPVAFFISLLFACTGWLMRNYLYVSYQANRPSWMTNLSFWLTLLIGGMLIFVLLLLLSAIWELSTLVRRGVSTQGVIEHFTIIGSSRVLPVIEFKTLTDPPSTYQTTSNGWFIYPKAGTIVNVIYNPKNPAENAFAGQRWRLMIFPIIFSIFELILLVLVLFLLYAFWFI